MKNTLLVIAFVALAFSCKKMGHPEASFKTDKSAYYLTQTVTFTNTSTGGSAYTWNFGDNATSIEKSPTHVYASPGTYRVKLIIGGSVSTKTIKVYPGNAGYVVYNNTGADSVHFTTFFHEKDSTNVEDVTDIGLVSKQGRSDTSFTFRAVLYLKGQLGATTFTVVEPYTLTKFDTKTFEIDNDTQVILDPVPLSTPINAGRSSSLQKHQQVPVSTLKAYLNQKQ